MKNRCLSLLLIIICGALLLGAGYKTPPVLPSKNFYVNDYAGIIFKEHREKLSELSESLVEQTGVQAVLLTVDNLNDMTLEDYAESILAGWEIGGREQNGVLLLYAQTEDAFCVLGGEALGQKLDLNNLVSSVEAITAPYLERGNYSTGLLNGYKETLRLTYLAFGLPVSDELTEQLKGEPSRRPLQYTAILFAMVIIVVLRCIWVTHKYRKKYLHRYQPKHQSFSREQGPDEDIDPIQPKVKRSGFIIYREQSEDAKDNDKLDNEK